MGLPPIEIVPEVIGSRPQIMRSRVDLPQPEGPTNTMNSPCSMARSTPWITATLPNDLATPESSIAAIDILSHCRRPQNAGMDAGHTARILSVIGNEEAAIRAQRRG